MININFIIAGSTPNARDPSLYVDSIKRFAETYSRFPAGAPHRLVLVDSNGGLTSQVASFFDKIPHEVVSYSGSGWDIGAHQYVAFGMPAEDWMFCLNSRMHFRQEGWLKAFVDAREKLGPGLYGATSSFERHPHIRGTAFFVQCERMQRYPHGCNSREESINFESGPTSLTSWFKEQGLGAWLVTPSVVVPLEQSRSIDNVFRRGDQSNIWALDNHTEFFDRATEEQKSLLSRAADGYPPPREKVGPWLRRLPSRVRRRIRAAVANSAYLSR